MERKWKEGKEKKGREKERKGVEFREGVCMICFRKDSPGWAEIAELDIARPENAAPDQAEPAEVLQHSGAE